MKKLAVALLAVAMLAVVTSNADAREPGEVSDNALAAIGLGQMEVVSDTEATEIRGMGAAAWGGVNIYSGFNNANSNYFSYGYNGAAGAAGAALPGFFGITWGVSGSIAVSW